ncbi:MAG: AMP-binding protein [Chloroflexi bacterium]|nr:AMP-binding protein [Chloroflexota bacterium]
MSLKLMLENTVRRYGKKTAIVLSDQRLSYADLDKDSNKVANALIKVGVNKGERVAMLLNNGPEFAIIYFGIVKIGAIAVLLDTNFRPDELASFLADSQCRVLVAENPALEPLVPVLDRFESIKHVIVLGAKGERQFQSYQEIMATGSGRRVSMELEPGDIAHITYSSGPSSQPRGIMMSHRCLVAETAIVAEAFQQTAQDIMMLYSLPLHHMFGLLAGLFVSVYKGSTTVIVSGTGLSLEHFLSTVEREKGTVFLGVPYIFALAVGMAEKEGIKHNLSSLRLCVSAGAPLPVDVVQRFKQFYGFDIFDFYGLSEAICLVTGQPVDGSGKLGSVGKVLPGWEVKIVDDNGQELPMNQSGEIIISGLMMTGYYHNPQATAGVIKNGWLYSGDIGRFDEAGYLFITGRKAKTIIVKGQNIYPEDIEMVLSRHPKVAGVRVTGTPDKLRGEVVRAVVTLKEGEVATEQEIKQFCLERLASYKVPRQVIFSNSLPKLVVGKVR